MRPRHRSVRQAVQRRRFPSIDDAAVERLASLLSADEVQRGMTRGAVAETVYEFAPPVPGNAVRGIRRARAGLQEEYIPERHQWPKVQRKDQRIRRRFCLDGVAAHQVCVGCSNVFIRHAGEVNVGEGGVELMAVSRDAASHRAAECFKRPRADAGLRVRRDVGGVDRAERRDQWQTTGIGLATFGGVAHRTIAQGNHAGAFDGEVLGERFRLGCGDGLNGRLPHHVEADHYGNNNDESRDRNQADAMRHADPQEGSRARSQAWPHCRERRRCRDDELPKRIGRPPKGM